ncbi:MAG: DUF427 domain-containing protein [Nitrospirales bacterium]|nr:DUF427 domain-containing protein [Nitrospirales bacterium]
MTTPSHPHAITITPNPNRIKVTFNGTVIADTNRAVTLREGPVPPVQYFPREDVTMTYLHPTAHSTHCPFKGDASYFTVSVNGRTAENAVWTYETPLASVADITNYMAFYPEKMDAMEEFPSLS